MWKLWMSVKRDLVESGFLEELEQPTFRENNIGSKSIAINVFSNGASYVARWGNSVRRRS